MACFPSPLGFDMQRCRQRALAALLWLVLLPAWAQDLTVVRADGVAVVQHATRLASLPRRELQATAQDKTDTYCGVELRDLLRAGGVEPPQALRGVLLKRLLGVTAADGYQVVFNFAELDPSLGNKRVQVADRMPGSAAPPAADGPWRLVVPAETRPTRWVRQVQRLAVVDAP